MERREGTAFSWKTGNSNLDDKPDTACRRNGHGNQRRVSEISDRYPLRQSRSSAFISEDISELQLESYNRLRERGKNCHLYISLEFCLSAFCDLRCYLDFVQDKEILKRAITDLKIELAKERRKVKRILVCGLSGLIMALLSLGSFCLVLAVKYWFWFVCWWTEEQLLELCAIFLLLLVISHLWNFKLSWKIMSSAYASMTGFKIGGQAGKCSEQIPAFSW